MDYALRRTASGSFESVSEAVEASIEAHGFVVVGMHDIHQTVASKGFYIHPVRIYEVRDAAASEAVRTRGIARPVPALVPGRISLFIEQGAVVVAAVKPGIVTDLYPESDLESAAVEVERRLIDIVDQVAPE